MTKLAAIQYALDAATLLHRGAQTIGNTKLSDQGLMGLATVMAAAQNRDVEAMDPSIRELILFGSTARGDENPHDVDLMLFDGGFYSNTLLASRMGSVYGSLKKNFQTLLTGWFGIDENDPEAGDVLLNARVDLLVLPEQMFTNLQRFLEIARRQSDPEFFENAFLKMQRFDADTNQFVGIDLTYFELKYGVDLSHLRKRVENPPRLSEEVKALLDMPGCHV